MHKLETPLLKGKEVLDPNAITEEINTDIEFSEDNPIELPKDVKFEVEGGDTIIPPGYN